MNQCKTSYLSRIAFLHSAMLFFAISCNTSSQSYSYELVTYAVVNNVKEKLPTTNHLISYGNFLFEFRFDYPQRDTIFPQSGRHKNSTRHDTAGVYLLDPVERTYYEFDRFSENARLIQSGKFSEKKFGSQLQDRGEAPVPFYKNKVMKDTLLWGMPLYYLENVEKDRSGNDSVLTHIFFRKDPGFVSMYELNLGAYPDSDFSMIGYSSNYIQEKILAEAVLENMRTLTSKEAKICEALLNKMK